MADNVDVTEGSGKTVASDEIQVDGSHASGQVQFIKIVDGTLNGTGSVRVNQAAKANALTVAPASDIADATYIGDIKFGEALPANTNTQEIVGDVAENAVAAGNPVLIGGRYDSSPRTLGNTDVGAIALDADGAVHIADGGNTITIDGSLTTVSTVTNLAQMGGAALAMNEGALGVGVQRVTLATDDDAVAHLATIAGDTTSLDGKIVVGGGAEAGAVLVTIANNSTGLVSVDDGGSTLSVDDGASSLTVDTTGTSGLEVVQSVAGDLNCTEASASAIKNAVEIMDDWDESDRAKVNTIAGQVGVQGAEGNITALTQRVTLAQDDDAVASLGIMDDWDATHASAASVDGPQIMGAGYSTGLPTDVGADGDAARICTDRFGRVLAGLMPQNFQATFTSADAQSAAPVKAKTGSRKMYILSLTVSTDTEMNIKFQDDNTPTVLIQPLYLAANGGAHLTWPPEAPLVCGTNFDFDVVASASGNISVTITGYLAV